MRLQSIGHRAAAAGALALLVTLALPPARAERAEGLFAHLAGSWSGSGTISFNSGTRERIRCRANYAPGAGGSTLRLDLRCASDSYKFELHSDLTSNSGSISGTWSETTRSVHGTISGSGTGGTINVTALSPTFSAFLRVSTRGNRQSISIRSPGSEMQEVAISLGRSGRR